MVVRRVVAGFLGLAGLVGGTPGLAADVVPLNGVGVSINENYAALKFDGDLSFRKSKAGSVFWWRVSVLEMSPNGIFDSSNLTPPGITRGYWLRTDNWASNTTYRVTVKQKAQIKLGYHDFNPVDGASSFMGSMRLDFKCQGAAQPADHTLAENSYVKQMNGAPEETAANVLGGETKDMSVALIHDFKPSEHCPTDYLLIELNVFGRRINLNAMEISILEVGSPL